MLIGLAALGCTPKPGKVCDHLGELHGGARPMAGDAAFQWKQRCIRELGSARDHDPSGYREAARCVMGLSGTAQGDAIRACVRPIATAMRVDNARTTAVESGEIPAPPRTAELVVNPAMDPRTVEFCVAAAQRGGTRHEPGTPEYQAWFRACTLLRAQQINTQELAREAAERSPSS